MAKKKVDGDQMMQMMQMMMSQIGNLDPASDPFAQDPDGGGDEDAGLKADIIRPADIKDIIKEQQAIETGTALDLLCLLQDGQHRIGGVPAGTTIAFCGPPGKGKSRTAIAAIGRIASAGKKVAYVVAEEGFRDPVGSGRDDLASRMTKIIMQTEGVTLKQFKDKIAPNIWVLLSQYHRGKTWADFVTHYRYLVEEEGIQFVVVDSLNALDPSKTRTADNLAVLKTYNHDAGVTCLTVGQIRDTGSPAGGECLMHTADVVFLAEWMSLSTKDMALEWGGEYREKILTLRCVKSVSTPTLGYQLRLVQSADAGVLQLHPDHPEMSYPVPPAKKKSKKRVVRAKK